MGSTGKYDIRAARGTSRGAHRHLRYSGRHMYGTQLCSCPLVLDEALVRTLSTPRFQSSSSISISSSSAVSGAFFLNALSSAVSPSASRGLFSPPLGGAGTFVCPTPGTKLGSSCFNVAHDLLFAYSMCCYCPRMAERSENVRWVMVGFMEKKKKRKGNIPLACHRKILLATRVARLWLLPSPRRRQRPVLAFWLS